MDKRYLASVAEEVRHIIWQGDTEKAVQAIITKDLVNEERDFIFMCLKTGGYDEKTGKFHILEGDNSAFLKLVNSVQEKVKKGK